MINRMRRREVLALAAPPLRGAPQSRPYLERVRTFAGTLIECGTDTYGAKTSPAWASVIDTHTWSVPAKGVPDPPGMRPNDRAVGGSNLYHDAVTLRAFLALAKVTGEARYARAATDYMRWYLAAARSSQTGLLAWGEHLYYDFHRDRVAVERRYHELLEWTPPWDLLWPVDHRAVTEAIAGLRFHHYEDRPGALFNRHAWYDRAEFQPQGGQPWIKHTGLFACSWAFLHARTKDEKWLAWARGDGGIYWERRNPATALTLSCIDDPRPGSRRAGVGTTLLAYWLRKAGVHVPGEAQFRQRALTFVKGWDTAAWQEGRGYLASLELDGKPASGAVLEPWHFAYGESSLLPYGRVAAHFARLDGDEQMLRAARRVAGIARAAPVPANAPVEGLGFALNLALDLHELEPRRGHLDQARHYADLACERYWHAEGRRGLFVRLAGDRYYEAKAGVGDLVAGLLRLDAALAGRRLPGDWSF